jgi:hypothetical protein
MVVEYENWTKDGDVVTSARYWRTAEVRVNTTPAICLDNPEDVGINIFAHFQEEDGLEYNLVSLQHSQIVEYPAGMRRKLREDLQDIWDEHENLECEGWNVFGTELWLFGPLSVQEKIETELGAECDCT